MPIGTWWRGDPLPNLSPEATFSAQRAEDRQLLARLANLSEQEIDRRMQKRNIPYVAFLDTTPAGYGWVATQTGEVAEMEFSFPIPLHNAYLWDFLTLPRWRGRQVYPHLLQAILQQEVAINRFWIGYDGNNKASGRGISKAGFSIIDDADLATILAGQAHADLSERIQAAADMFQFFGGTNQ